MALFGRPATGEGLLINLTSEHINYIASLLATEFEADLITAPQITTLNGKTAVFNAGAKIPFDFGRNIIIDGGVDNIQQFFYKHVGTYIAVTPQVVEKDLINLDIVVRLSEEGNRVRNTSSTSTALEDDEFASSFTRDIITAEDNVRAISNTVQVTSGHGVVMGGLIGMIDTESVSKVPVLGDVPLVGFLFRSKSTAREKAETLIFVEAAILPPPDAVDELGNSMVELATSDDFCDGKQHLKCDLCNSFLFCGMFRAGLTGNYLPPLRWRARVARNTIRPHVMLYKTDGIEGFIFATAACIVFAYLPTSLRRSGRFLRLQMSYLQRRSGHIIRCA